MEIKALIGRFPSKTNTCRLTNVRYADDILLFAKSRGELQRMMVTLIEDLREIGLEVNTSKTKVLTNEISGDPFIMVGEEKLTIVGEHETHKYLGRYLSGVFENRSFVEVSHRIQCARHKFSRHSSTLCNTNVSISFDSNCSISL